jgi:hypothetical protein
VRFSASTFLAPNLHQFSSVVQSLHFFGAIWDKLNGILASNFLNGFRNSAFYSAIWDELAPKHKKTPYLMPD